jgi:hypothetical protein
MWADTRHDTTLAMTRGPNPHAPKRLHTYRETNPDAPNTVAVMPLNDDRPPWGIQATNATAQQNSPSHDAA